ncbi:O-fucosyltransferase 27-like isoform X1 [Juglans microcarpa x Juglans regia]|uniref:O-fucosyltransferase 27-like isoform X1 n=2 Tax=Juglans microcarpa x Juglans regia TaxID=2249226 RepID=UPI001B7E37C8|nr:O-fucosyltransferase 27-like isoform X1 [Juglans microcarpa x Juglans regia]
MKGQGKMFLNSRLKWIGLFGLLLSAFSLFIHFLLARFTEGGIIEYQSSITVFSWRPIFESANFPRTSPMYRRLWGPIRLLESLHPDANPRGYYADPSSQTNGLIFVRIQGGFHEIRNSICDVVVVSRLLNATLVIPEIQSTTRSKGISSEFKSFAYLYNEDQFMAALTKDVNIVRTLPKNLKWARRKKEIPSFKVRYSASPYYYLNQVLLVLKKHSVVELVVSEGGCLQAILPPELEHQEELQRLRCRVAFHALRFRQEVHELATKVLSRLRAPGWPFIAYDPGMTREALAYHGCAELFQDVHTELIQHKRSWMIKRGIVEEKLSVNSAKRRLGGSCPLMPEEVGILLRAYGYSWDTIIYVSGGEVFGGQRTLLPLHAMFENVVDKTSLTTPWELSRLYGREVNHISSYPKNPPPIEKKIKYESWKTEGPRPRPLPPPPARPKSYNVEGWWGWVAESDNEPESTVMELRTNAHKLLWEAIDYVICVEADVFITGFDYDGKGHPNFASLVMGHRLYQSAALKTYRPDRKEVAKLLEEIHDHLYQANHTWLKSVRKHMRQRLLDGLMEASTKSKPLSFLSHPVPECSCLRYDSKETSFHSSSPSTQSQVQAALGVGHQCPAWMDSDLILHSKDKDNEEDLDEDNSTSSGLFFRNSGESHESGGGGSNNKEVQLDDLEELEGGER